jgi:hypothetical protein
MRSRSWPILRSLSYGLVKETIVQWDSSADSMWPLQVELGVRLLSDLDTHRRITPMFAENPIRLAQGTWRSPHELRIN